MIDADRDEAAFDRVFGSVPPVAPPVGFRDGVMRRVRGDTWSVVEVALALALALPSLAFLAWDFASEGLDLQNALGNLLTITAVGGDQAFFSVDGILVIAFALLGLGALVGSHALLRRP
ncbi:MAG: hypothetical protein KGK34_04160 [Chloroflexota bacterium]|nr:hypothetical protein [Chloroflexota bacterium]